MPQVSDELIYRTSSLIESLKVIPIAPQFLRDNLFPRIVEVATDQVAVETYNGSQKLAPYASRFSKGTAVPREVTKTSFFSPPHIKPIRSLTSDDLFYKSAAAASAGGGDRNAELMVIDFQELDAAIGRREEWMASEVLFKGTVTCLDGDTNEVVAELTYGAPTKTVPAKLWSDPTGDPLADLRAALRLVSSACGASADIVIWDAQQLIPSRPTRKCYRPTTSFASARAHWHQPAQAGGFRALEPIAGFPCMSTRPNIRTLQGH